MQERRIIVRMKGSREIARRDMADQIKASCQTRRSRIDIRFANFYKLLQTLHAVAALNDKRGRCLGQIITKAHWLPFFSIFRLLGARRRWFLWPTEILGEAVAPTTTRLWNENSVVFCIYNTSIDAVRKTKFSLYLLRLQTSFGYQLKKDFNHAVVTQ